MSGIRRILVVGAQGGLGRAWRSRLESGPEVVALGHADLDVTRRNDVLERVREIRPDVILNAAGVADVDACETDRWRAYLTNRDGAEHLARAAAEVGALVVYPSTDLVFDGTRATPYGEEDPPNPINVYGDTKLAGELAVMSHAPRYLILRAGWLFGPYGRNFLSDALDARETEEVVFVHDDQRGQPTYQLDFADATLELLRRGETGVWHVAPPDDATPYEAACVAFQMLGERSVSLRPRRQGFGARAALRPRYTVLDGTKLARAGIRLRPWREALKSFLGPKAVRRV